MVLSISIVYFSGTGNTEIVANLINEKLKKDHDTEIIKIEDILKKKITYNIEKYNLIGIGFPIYGFNAPRILFDFVKTLPHSNKTKIFIFSTSSGPLYFNDIAAYGLKKKLKQKGFQVFYEKQFYMPPNIVIPYNKKIIKQLYNAAMKKTAEMANDISVFKEKIRNDIVIPKLLIGLTSIEQISARTFATDLKILNSCNLCKKCIDNCPQNNIKMNNNNITFGLNCITCFRCIYSCPNKSITPRLYKLIVLKEGYNIKKIIEDKSIEGDFITPQTKGYYKIFHKYLFEE